MNTKNFPTKKQNAERKPEQTNWNMTLQKWQTPEEEKQWYEEERIFNKAYKDYPHDFFNSFPDCIENDVYQLLRKYFTDDIDELWEEEKVANGSIVSKSVELECNTRMEIASMVENFYRKNFAYIKDKYKSE
jgi:hypothetical protein|tara:strand:+ start:171 stop:566 length:396 start_codon:yes stop_codon:yes gene_type:complete